jgi:hypothetical protein
MALNDTTKGLAVEYIFSRASLEETAADLALKISPAQIKALKIIAEGDVRYYYSGNKVRMTAANGVTPAMLGVLEVHSLVSSKGRSTYTATLTPLARKVLEIKG